MTVFWWIAGIALAITAGGATISFLLYIIRGEDRFLEVARKFKHWVIVIALLTFDVAIFKHVILTLWQMWF